jgi:hypothetical protein
MTYKLYRWVDWMQGYRLETYKEFDDKIRAYEFARDNHQEDGESLSYQEKWKLESEKETVYFATNIEMRMEFLNMETK